MLDKELLVTTGIPSTNVEIEQQKEYVDTLYYLMNERETELNHARNCHERAVKRWAEEKFKLNQMKKEYDQN
jgi:hypothetical protein